MLRGSHLTPGEPAPRGFPTILGGESLSVAAGGSGRLELAAWLTDPRHPLTARVMANRVWKGHFGEGLVRSTDNFGLLGDRPDHPALLDWLASRFVEGDWSIKALHRMIMLSSAYQMDSAPNSSYAEVDPQNRLLWRMNRRRMEAEVIRDSLLAVSGRLDLQGGGKAMSHPNFVNLSGDNKSRDPALYASDRRSVYLPVIRSALYELFEAFDFSNPSTINGKRSTTTVAPQALFMMNSEQMEQASRSIAERIAPLDGAIESAYRVIHLRPPTTREFERSREFLTQFESTAKEDDPVERRTIALQGLCRVLLSSNEFVYVM